MPSLRNTNTLNLMKQFLSSFTFFFLPLMLFDMGISGLEIGILMSLFTVVSLFSSFPIGAINDRLGTRHVIITGLLLESVFFFGLFVSGSFLALLPFFICGGLGGNMIDTSIRGAVFKTLGSERKGRKLGTFQLLTSGGFGVGMVLGGLLLRAFDFSGVMLLTSAAFLLLAFASYFLADTGKSRFPVSDYGTILVKRSTVVFLFPLFLFGIHWGAENTSYSLFLREVLGLDFVSSGIYMGIPIILLGVFSFWAGLKVDRGRSHRKTLFSGLLISGIGHIMMAYPVVWVSFAFRIIHEIGDALSVIGYHLSFSKIFRTERISGEAGAAYTIMTTGSVTGAIIFGSMGAAWGYQWPFIISGVLSLFAVVLLYIQRKKADF